MDVDAASVEIARSSHPRVWFVVASVEEEDLPAQVGDNYDVVVALEMIEHLFRPRLLFAQSARLLGPEGWLHPGDVVRDRASAGLWKSMVLVARRRG